MPALLRPKADNILPGLGWVMTNWANCPDTHQSTSGLCTFFGSTPISWKTKKQSVVSRSITKVEYRFVAQATCELQWLQFLFADFSLNFSSPALLYYDNEAAHHIATSPIFHERTKHIELDCHFIPEKNSS